MMGTERFPETLCFLSELTRLTAREEFIASCRRESFKSHKTQSVGLQGPGPGAGSTENTRVRPGQHQILRTTFTTILFHHTNIRSWFRPARGPDTDNQQLVHSCDALSVCSELTSELQWHCTRCESTGRTSWGNWVRSGSGNLRRLGCAGCFRSCSLPGTVRDNTLHTGVRYAVILPTRQNKIRCPQSDFK
jgi:hypothetical protein